MWKGWENLPCELTTDVVTEHNSRFRQYIPTATTLNLPTLLMTVIRDPGLLVLYYLLNGVAIWTTSST